MEWGNRQENKTRPDNLSYLKPTGELEEFISPNQGHLKKNGLYHSFLTKEHIV